MFNSTGKSNNLFLWGMVAGAVAYNILSNTKISIGNGIAPDFDQIAIKKIDR